GEGEVRAQHDGRHHLSFLVKPPANANAAANAPVSSSVSWPRKLSQRVVASGCIQQNTSPVNTTMQCTPMTPATSKNAARVVSNGGLSSITHTNLPLPRG